MAALVHTRLSFDANGRASTLSPMRMSQPPTVADIPIMIAHAPHAPPMWRQALDLSDPLRAYERSSILTGIATALCIVGTALLFATMQTIDYVPLGIVRAVWMALCALSVVILTLGVSVCLYIFFAGASDRRMQK